MIGPAVSNAFESQTAIPLQLIWGDSKVKNFYIGEYGQGDYDAIVDLNTMTITFTPR
jgi:hypothetical protein